MAGLSIISPDAREELRQVRVGLSVMWRVIFALMLREARTRFGKSNIGYLWAVIDPLVQMLVLWGIYSVFGRHVPVATSMPVFLITGILPFNYWKGCVARGASAIGSNLPLLTYPQVRAADVVISRTLLEAATTVVVVLIFVVGLKVFYGEPFSSWVDEPAPLVAALLALFYFGISFAFFSANVARIFPAWTEIFGYFSRPLWFMSGIFFTLESLPHNARAYAAYNPIAHMLEWLRSAALPGFESTHYSPLYVLGWATCVLAIGLALDRILTWTGHTDSPH